MKKLRSFPKTPLLVLAGTLALATVSHAVVVDWLNFTPGADRRHFSLYNDAGLPFAQAELQITTGVLGPFSPSAALLENPYWVTTPGFTDSQSATTTIPTTKIQIAPQAGAVSYELTISGANLSGLTFSLGELFGTPGGGTRAVNISALTAAGLGVPVTFLETDGWDNGIRFNTQPLNWDAPLGTLSLDPAANGESAFAFFRVPQTGSAVTQLKFSVPSGYNVGTGDAVQFAFAAPVAPVVPEPSTALTGLALACASLCSRARSGLRNASRGGKVRAA